MSHEPSGIDTQTARDRRMSATEFGLDILVSLWYADHIRTQEEEESWRPVSRFSVLDLTGLSPGRRILES